MVLLRKSDTSFKSMIALLLITLVMLFGSFANAPVTAAANSAAPIRADDGGGIVFKEHEHVEIAREVLDIQINDNATANLRASYIMKNTSDAALRVETMFLAPVEYGWNREISVQRNGIELDFRQEFFGYVPYDGNNAAQSIEDWEAILNNLKSRSKPLGDGTGFWEYRVSGSSLDWLYIKFLPDSLYFRESQGLFPFEDGTVELSNTKSYYGIQDDIRIVTRQELSPETNGNLTRTEIADIYEYLRQNAIQNVDEEQLIFAEQQFNHFLHNFDVERLEHDFFRFEYIYSYVGATTYYVDFAPEEELELAVSYIYQMGTSGYRNKAELRYYLSPTKYWKDFAEIEINLTLSPKFKKLESSSLSFRRTSENSYRFAANALPDTELRITVSDGNFFTANRIYGIFIISFVHAAAGIMILVPAGIIWAIVNRAKRHGNTAR